MKFVHFELQKPNKCTKSLTGDYQSLLCCSARRQMNYTHILVLDIQSNFFSDDFVFFLCESIRDDAAKISKKKWAFDTRTFLIFILVSFGLCNEPIYCYRFCSVNRFSLQKCPKYFEKKKKKNRFYCSSYITILLYMI